MTRHICLISLLLSSGNGLLPVQAEMLSQESTQQEAQESETGQSSNATSAAATSPMTIYKVVGKDGSVTYTDKPQQNAEPLRCKNAKRSNRGKGYPTSPCEAGCPQAQLSRSH